MTFAKVISRTVLLSGCRNHGQYLKSCQRCEQTKNTTDSIWYVLLPKVLQNDNLENTWKALSEKQKRNEWTKKVLVIGCAIHMVSLQERPWRPCCSRTAYYPRMSDDIPELYRVHFIFLPENSTFRLQPLNCLFSLQARGILFPWTSSVDVWVGLELSQHMNTRSPRRLMRYQWSQTL